MKNRILSKFHKTKKEFAKRILKIPVRIIVTFDFNKISESRRNPTSVLGSSFCILSLQMVNQECWKFLKAPKTISTKSLLKNQRLANHLSTCIVCCIVYRKSFVQLLSTLFSYYQLCSATNITIQMQFSSVQNINMVYGDLSKVSQVLSEYIIK